MTFVVMLKMEDERSKHPVLQKQARNMNYRMHWLFQGHFGVASALLSCGATGSAGKTRQRKKTVTVVHHFGWRKVLHFDDRRKQSRKRRHFAVILAVLVSSVDH